MPETPQAFPGLAGLPAGDKPGIGDILVDQSDPISRAELSDRELVRHKLRLILLDDSAPHAAVAQAARTLAEMAQAIGRQAKVVADEGRPLGELTRAELEAELTRERGE